MADNQQQRNPNQGNPNNPGGQQGNRPQQGQPGQPGQQGQRNPNDRDKTRADENISEGGERRGENLEENR